MKRSEIQSFLFSRIREKLMGILPAALAAVGAAGIIHLANNYLSKAASAEVAVAKSAMMQESALAMAPEAPAEAAPLLTQNLALWFLAGALFALLIYFIVGMIRKGPNQ